MKNTKVKKHTKEIAIGIFSGVLNGLFGAGGGSVVVPCLEKFLKIEPKKSHATAVLIILLMSIVSSAVYFFRGAFDFKIWLPITIGGILGGICGGTLLNKISVKWLKIIFGTVISVTALKMIF